MKGIFSYEKIISTNRLFSEKYILYGDMLFRICMIYLGNKEVVEEVMQEAFIKLMYNCPNFNNDEHEKASLIRITANIYKDMQRYASKSLA